MRFIQYWLIHWADLPTAKTNSNVIDESNLWFWNFENNPEHTTVIISWKCFPWDIPTDRKLECRRWYSNILPCRDRMPPRKTSVRITPPSILGIPPLMETSISYFHIFPIDSLISFWENTSKNHWLSTCRRFGAYMKPFKKTMVGTIIHQIRFFYYIIAELTHGALILIKPLK